MDRRYYSGVKNYFSINFPGTSSVQMPFARLYSQQSSSTAVDAIAGSLESSSAVIDLARSSAAYSTTAREIRIGLEVFCGVPSIFDFSNGNSRSGPRFSTAGCLCHRAGTAGQTPRAAYTVSFFAPLLGYARMHALSRYGMPCVGGLQSPSSCFRLLVRHILFCSI